ncbi:NrfD/PsrC family molybdoenzyme membrane anchor subunit [Singulisphaera rosea]
MGGEDPTPAIETGYLSQDVTKVPGWHGLVAWDVLFNNMTTGLFLFAAVGELAAPRLLGPVARLAYPVALVFLIIDLLLLVSDLGDPLRFHHMLRVFKPSSPMSLGTWSLTAYSQPLALIVAIEAALWLNLLPQEMTTLEWIRKVLVVVGIVPAFGSVAYKGVLFSTCSQPGWKDARWLGGFMANSALTLGSAQMLALAVLAQQDRAVASLRVVTAMLVVLNLIPTGFVFLEIHQTLARIYAKSQIYRALVLIPIVGTLAPVMLLLVADGVPWILAGVLLVVVGAFVVRSLFLKIPHASHASRSRHRS